MNYNRFKIKSGGLETISDLEKERCLEADEKCLSIKKILTLIPDQ